jgi:hypothetical protein
MVYTETPQKIIAFNLRLHATVSRYPNSMRGHQSWVPCYFPESIHHPIVSRYRPAEWVLTTNSLTLDRNDLTKHAEFWVSGGIGAKTRRSPRQN